MQNTNSHHSEVNNAHTVCNNKKINDNRPISSSRRTEEKVNYYPQNEYCAAQSTDVFCGCKKKKEKIPRTELIKLIKTLNLRNTTTS